MTKLSFACGLALSAVLAACASAPHNSPAAASAAPAAGTTTVAAAGDKPKLVCEDSTQIGSHFKQRICMTPEEAEARRKAAQAMFNQSGHTNPCGNNPCGQPGSPPRR